MSSSRPAAWLHLLTLAVAASACDARAPGGQKPVAEPPRAEARRAPLLVTVDHFFATSPDAEALFELFRGTLELPVAWPFRRYGDFASGAVSVGNTALEFATWEVPAGEVLKTEWSMLAFEPAGDTEAAVAELDRRGIPHSEPDVNTYRDASGKVLVGWTNTGLTAAGLSEAVFICDYEERQEVAASRKAKSEELVRRKGGPLGVHGLKEIVIGVKDLDAARRDWRMLIDDPGQESADVFRFGGGPSVRIVRAERPGIREIVLRVDSLERAREFLARRQMLGGAAGTGVAIAPGAIGGLSVSLAGE